MAPVSPEPDRLSILSAYLDGELRDGELEVVVGLLGVEPDAAVEFRMVRDAKRVLRALPELDPPEGLLDAAHYGDRLSAYLDGELPTSEATVIVHHLTTCRVCREELYELDRSRVAVRALPGIEAPPFLVEETAPRREPPRRRHRPAARPIAAATVGLIAVLALLSLLRSPTPAPTVTLTDLGTRHVARVSVEPGFTVLPASVGGVEP